MSSPRRSRLQPRENSQDGVALKSAERSAVIRPVAHEHALSGIPPTRVWRAEPGWPAEFAAPSVRRVSPRECGRSGGRRRKSDAGPRPLAHHALCDEERIRSRGMIVATAIAKRVQPIRREAVRLYRWCQRVVELREVNDGNISRGVRPREVLVPPPSRVPSGGAAWSQPPGQACGFALPSAAAPSAGHARLDDLLDAIVGGLSSWKLRPTRWTRKGKRWTAVRNGRALPSAGFALLAFVRLNIALASTPKVSGRAGHQLPSRSTPQESEGIPCAGSTPDSGARVPQIPGTSANTLPNSRAADGWRS